MLLELDALVDSVQRPNCKLSNRILALMNASALPARESTGWNELQVSKKKFLALYFSCIKSIFPPYEKKKAQTLSRKEKINLSQSILSIREFRRQKNSFSSYVSLSFTMAHLKITSS
jgi:hypothetical protein